VLREIEELKEAMKNKEDQKRALEKRLGITTLQRLGHSIENIGDSKALVPSCACFTSRSALSVMTAAIQSPKD
jgi:hypothetical protein